MTFESESSLLHHTSCDECGSSDGNGVYDDGHTYCFVCTAYGTEDGGARPASAPKSNNPSLMPTGRYEDLPSRHLKAETLKFFGYSLSSYMDQPCHIAPLYDSKGVLTAQKIRLPGKDFRVVGNLDKCGLFGENKWKSGGKRLVITEGELDALSYSQCSPGWEVVSIPNGSSGAAKAIARSIEFIDSFGEVVFLFDNDEPGIEAARECAAIVAPGKAKIASLPLKDANEMLKAGRVKELKTAIYGAKVFRPDGIVSGSDVSLESLQENEAPGYTIPYPELNAMLKGIRKAKLYMITAGSGIGKSTLAKELGVHLQIEHGLRVGYLLLEEGFKHSAKTLIAMDNDVPVDDLALDRSLLTEDQWSQSYDKMIAPGTACFYDSWGSLPVEVLVARVKYMAVAMKVDFIILDHVSMVVSGMDVDERKELDVLMTNLRSLCEQVGVGIIAVAHLKRVGSKDFNEGAQISLTDLRGSASLEQLSDVVIAAERDQQGEDPFVVLYRVLKNRPASVTGPAGHAKYNTKTGRSLAHTVFDDETKPGANNPFDESGGVGVPDF